MSEFNQTKYINEFIKEKYDIIKVQMPKGKKDEIKKMLIDYDISMSGYIKTLVEEHMSLDEESRNKRLMEYAKRIKEAELERAENKIEENGKEEKHPGGA